jgi:hypothetical protein
MVIFKDFFIEMGLPCKIISVAAPHLFTSLAKSLCQRIMRRIVVTCEDHLELMVVHQDYLVAGIFSFINRAITIFVIVSSISLDILTAS